MKVLAFAASTSKKSINKQLVSYAANLLNNAENEEIKQQLIAVVSELNN